MKKPFDINGVISVATMRDTTGEEWEVVLHLNGLQEPLVCIRRDKLPENKYHLSTFVGCGGRSGFAIAPPWLDEDLIRFAHSEWLSACTAVLAATPGNLGHVQAVWVPSDPSLPF